MASDAAMAETFKGSLLSIITKFKFRYEGILQDIDVVQVTIGLRNVRSFGTEGRKKDGPQVPPSDKVYEYILFRANDIQHMDVIHAPPAQTSLSIYNDPAILQESCPPPVSISSHSAGSGSADDPSLYTAQEVVPSSTFLGDLPLYQPGGSSGSEGPPSAGGDSHSLPMYWQGFHGPSNGLSHIQQQSLAQSPHAFSVSESMQQPIYPGVSGSIRTGLSNLPASSVLTPNLSDPNTSPPNLPASNRGHTSALLPPFSIGSASLTPAPSQSAPALSQSVAFPPSLASNIASSTFFSSTLQNASMPSVSQLPSSGLDTDGITLSGSMHKTSPILPLPCQTTYHSVSTDGGVLRSSNSETSPPSLVTPGQFLQWVPTTLFSSDPVKKDVKVTQAELSKPSPPAPVIIQALLPKPPQPSPVTTHATMIKPSPSAPVTPQAPILPLPPPNQKLSAPPSYTRNNCTNKGHERGMKNWKSRPVTSYREDFDFKAMNEKFKKDEVWGDLGNVDNTRSKENRGKDDNRIFSEGNDELGLSKVEKSVYVKDDFFDSLSCQSLDNRERYGRTRFSAQVRTDSETFGDFPRHRGGRGGQWPGRGGRSRGSFYGRGYGYVGRGQRHY